MSKMFRSVTHTNNIITGCTHVCVYCTARDLANGRLRERYLANKNLALPLQPQTYREATGEVCLSNPYHDPFYHRFWPERLKTPCKPGETIFLNFMGDAFCKEVPSEWIQQEITYAAKYPDTDFLLCTKNPARYAEFEFPSNVILGATIETTFYSDDYSKAPSLMNRIFELSVTLHPRKFISIEPIMGGDMDLMIDLISVLRPEVIEIGADNHRKHLPEPSAAEVRQLLDGLRKALPDCKVIEKEGLERLLK
jgi:protein gp37